MKERNREEEKIVILLPFCMVARNLYECYSIFYWVNAKVLLNKLPVYQCFITNLIIKDFMTFMYLKFKFLLPEIIFEIKIEF